MKYLGVVLVGLMMFAMGCGTNNIVAPITEEEQLAIDLDLIDNWLIDSAIADVIVHPSTDIRYTINKKGTGEKAEVANVLRVSYEGRILDTGVLFDLNYSFDFILNSGGIIPGWYFMLQEMEVGDEFTIYLPSKYGYGPSGNGLIGPNEILMFDITLIRIGN